VWVPRAMRGTWQLCLRHLGICVYSPRHCAPQLAAQAAYDKTQLQVLLDRENNSVVKRKICAVIDINIVKFPAKSAML
jgi:hypothetical protein